ncbi:uncharacterized protein M6D78_011555 isoform 1-T1 [Vipera latastei]
MAEGSRVRRRAAAAPEDRLDPVEAEGGRVGEDGGVAEWRPRRLRVKRARAAAWSLPGQQPQKGTHKIQIKPNLGWALSRKWFSHMKRRTTNPKNGSPRPLMRRGPQPSKPPGRRWKEKLTHIKLKRGASKPRKRFPPPVLKLKPVSKIGVPGQQQKGTHKIQIKLLALSPSLQGPQRGKKGRKQGTSPFPLLETHHSSDSLLRWAAPFSLLEALLSLAVHQPFTAPAITLLLNHEEDGLL